MYIPTQFPDESGKLPMSQLSAVHTLGDAPRRVSESLQVKQCAGLAGLEQVAQESSHPVWSITIYKKKILMINIILTRWWNSATGAETSYCGISRASQLSWRTGEHCPITKS